MTSTSDSTGTSGSSNEGGSTGSGEISLAGGWSDRVLGVVCVLIAIWYTIEARTFDVPAVGSGPVGPKTLPTIIGVMFGVLALYLIVKPDRSPRWPTAKAWWQLILVVFSSYLYGRTVEPIGFIAASAAMMMVIGLLFRAPLRQLILGSLLFPVVVSYVFNNWLELQLPAGWWGGISL